VEEGIRSIVWPARFQVLAADSEMPETVLDVAHNPAGAWALRSALSTFYEDRPLTFIFGAMRDKAIHEIADILFPLAERVIAVQAESPRAASTADIIEAASHTGTEIIPVENMQRALETARKLAWNKGVVVITGSIYVVGEALSIFNKSSVRQTV